VRRAAGVHVRDETCLVGEQTAVADAVSHLATAAAAIGLEFSLDKCELIPAARQSSQLDATLSPSSTKVVADGCFELLGGPAGTAECCQKHAQKQVDKAKVLLESVEELADPQVAFLLLWHCASFGELVYSARAVPFNTRARAVQKHMLCASVCANWCPPKRAPTRQVSKVQAHLYPGTYRHKNSSMCICMNWRPPKQTPTRQASKGRAHFYFEFTCPASRD
jgi:hypothetical protein